VLHAYYGRYCIRSMNGAHHFNIFNPEIFIIMWTVVMYGVNETGNTESNKTYDKELGNVVKLSTLSRLQ